MTKEEFIKQVEVLNLKHWRNEEYHRDEYSGVIYVHGKKNEYQEKVDILIDYYTVRIVWYYDERRKVSKSYYINKEVADYVALGPMMTDFFSQCIKEYSIDRSCR